MAKLIAWMAERAFLLSLLAIAATLYAGVTWLERRGATQESLKHTAAVATRENKDLRKQIGIRKELDEIRNDRPDGPAVADCLRRHDCF